MAYCNLLVKKESGMRSGISLTVCSDLTGSSWRVLDSTKLPFHLLPPFLSAFSLCVWLATHTILNSFLREPGYLRCKGVKQISIHTRTVVHTLLCICTTYQPSRSLSLFGK